MSKTCGKKIRFTWFYKRDQLTIRNEKGRVHRYSHVEIFQVLSWLNERFGQDWFPLANNVATLGKGEEKPGLGTAILAQTPGDITHAQGVSYLGVVLDEVGIFSWNGAMKGIQWRISRKPGSAEELRRFLEGASN